jgi:hypothetical protein
MRLCVYNSASISRLLYLRFVDENRIQESMRQRFSGTINGSYSIFILDEILIDTDKRIVVTKHTNSIILLPDG